MHPNSFDDMRLHTQTLTPVKPGNEIVISGIAGRFPECNNIHELRDNLMNKVDLVTDDGPQYRFEYSKLPNCSGKMKNLDKFDALFFGVGLKQADVTDPNGRVLLEHTYEAIIDAGVNPKELSGTRTGVFIGSCVLDLEKSKYFENSVDGLALLGCSQALYANRISYWLNVKGPSYMVEVACSSSLYALEHAYRAMREGNCDAAIVGGVNVNIDLDVSLEFLALGVLSKQGRNRAFDESADGLVRSQGVSVIFLQKAKDAKRIYAEIVHAKTSCDGLKKESITYPSSYDQCKLLKELYLECGVSPSDVDYIEAHGTGTKAGDPVEIAAIDEALAFNRTKDSPLLIGSVKSNLGHTEGCSGLTGVTKVIIAMESKMIPPNLHFKKCNKKLKGIIEGRIKVVTDPLPWKGGYAGVSSFGFGGTNSHALLKSHSKEKLNNGVPDDDLPRLVVTSGRTEEAVSYILNDLGSKPVDKEQIRLLHDIHSDDINGHLYRGYTVLPAQGVNETPSSEIKTFSDSKRPVWFIFTGMGSQWPGMGEALLRMPIIADAVHNCDIILKPHGINIYNIITNKDKTMFDNVLNSFVGNAAIQIGLVNVLDTLGIKPDYMIGHSVGELGCAYADGCFTAEQMILAAYYRGLVSIESKFIHGSMAALGIGYKELKNLCPSDIDIACRNSLNNATISGPTKSVKKYVAELQARNIFAKEVHTGNIPYHSRYIQSSGAKFLSYLRKIIPDPKRRSEKWLSTSVPKDRWDSHEAQFSSAEYHQNNYLNPVLFEDVSHLIPENAIAIEIAPHGLLQPILRRSLHPSIANIPLTLRGHRDNVEVLLQALGKMFNAGLHPQIANIYPNVEYPVSSSTPMISPLVKWEHSESFYVPSSGNDTSNERKVKISLADEAYSSMAGHAIDGRILLPATGYLKLVWETFSMIKSKNYLDTSVIFEDVEFLRATNMSVNDKIVLTITIDRETGRFKVAEGDVSAVTGMVRLSSNPVNDRMDIELPIESMTESLASDDVYKELRLRGYEYRGIFRSIKKATCNGEKAHIAWQNDWIAFMDNMLQLAALSVDTRELVVPTNIKRMLIDPSTHLSQAKSEGIDEGMEVYHSKLHNVISSPGIEIRGLDYTRIAKRKPISKPVLEEYVFVPNTDGADVTLREISRLSLQIGMENHTGVKVKTIELIDEPDHYPMNHLLSPWLFEALIEEPLVQPDIIILSSKNEFAGEISADIRVMDPKKISGDGSAILAVGHQLLKENRFEYLKLLQSELEPNGFLLSREIDGDIVNFEKAAERINCHFIMFKKFGSENLILLKKRSDTNQKAVVVKVNNETFNWVDEMHRSITESMENNAKTIIVGEGDFENGLMGFINCLRTEIGEKVVRGILIQDPNAPEFSLDDPFYTQQIKKDLFVSVLRENGVWGNYRHLPLPPVDKAIVHHARMAQKVHGDLSSLTWVEGPIHSSDSSADIIEIHYFSINFKDVMMATGRLPMDTDSRIEQDPESISGNEFCGVTRAGKRVMGSVNNRSMSNLCVANPNFIWEVPEQWTLEDAATVPCVYMTCYYALYMKGQMRKDHTVLIHSGAGGIGQAAINLALREGCEVFTTVGTPEKRRFIREYFPQIKEDHIGNSRDTSFEQMIKEKTRGRGVDIVLNSLSQEKLRASINCLAKRGQFLEIGTYDLKLDTSLGMKCFLRGISFHGAMANQILLENDKFDFTTVALKKLFMNGLKTGAVKPLIRTVFTKDHVEDAFRYMTTGKHIGKVIVKVQDEKVSVNNLLAEPRFYCLGNRSYIILGGLGGFGIELADWMVMRGARNLVISSRTGIKNGYQKMRIELWKSYGTNVIIVTGKDLSSRKECQDIIETAAKLAPVDGIFNSAVVLNDAAWENQTAQSFRDSFVCKATATRNFDILTRQLCPELRHFVVFSSMSCGRGNPGQTNYGMANSVMERICEKRVAEGLPGLAIQWGAIGDVGLVAEVLEKNEELIIRGTKQQKVSSCLQELDRLLKQNRPVVSSMVVAEKKVSSSTSLNILDTVLGIMGLRDVKGVNTTSSLSELGMDSMMAVEIKQRLDREFELYLTTQEIRDLNFKKLQEMVDKTKPGENEINNLTSDMPDNTEMTGFIDLIRGVITEIQVNPEVCSSLETKAHKDGSKVIIVPGLDCTLLLVTDLAKKLEFHTKGLQTGMVNFNFDAIPEVADFYLPYVLKEAEDGSAITLVGYSFGCLTTIELIRRLEAYNINARFILVDGAPLYQKTPFSQGISNDSDEQNMSLMLVCNALFPRDLTMIISELSKCKTWEEKLDNFIKVWPKSGLILTEEDKRNICMSTYRKVQVIKKYEPENLPPMKSPILFLKASEASAKLEARDYGLSELTTGHVEVYTVTGNHLTILDNQKVADAINGYPIEDDEPNN